MRNIVSVVFFLIGVLIPPSRETVKIYFIKKLSLNLKNEMSDDRIKDERFLGVTAHVHLLKDRYLVDSTTVEAEDISMLKDTISFSLSVPRRYVSNGNAISVTPVYHVLNKNKGFGFDKANLDGKEEYLPLIHLKIKSKPSGATVYLVPKLFWERNPLFSKHDPNLLSHYIVSEGATTVCTTAQDYVYIALFQLGKKYKKIECSPNHRNPTDSLYLKLN